MHMLMYRCALAAVAEVHACVCRCARAVSVVRVVCVRARAIAGAVGRGAHLSARRMGTCVPVSFFCTYLAMIDYQSKAAPEKGWVWQEKNFYGFEGEPGGRRGWGLGRRIP